MDNKAPEAFRTISEVADELDVPQHVLRFWETRFHEIRPMKRGGGRRYYRPDDVDLLRGIRHLLYGEGYTIRGVQRILSEEGQKFVQAVWQSGATQPPHRGDVSEEQEADDILPDETPEQPDGLRGRLASLVGRDLNEPVVEQRRDPPLQSAPVPRVDPPLRAMPVAPQAAPAPYPQPPVAPRVTVEPPLAGPQVSVPPPAAAPEPSLYAPRHDARQENLPREDLRKLQAAMHELAECRKLLNAVSPA